MRKSGQDWNKMLAGLLPALLSACSPSARPEAEGAASYTRPERIVSVNPCIDAVLREVVDAGQIAGISHYSLDPRATSVPIDWARRFIAVGDEAEDVVAARPDLVLAGPHVAPQTVSALERLGIHLVRFDVPSTIAENKSQIEEIGQITGQKARARALNARIDAAVASAARDNISPDAPAALIWQDGGLVPGKGTLADELLVHTGFRSAARTLGLAQWDMISLERLLNAAPDIVLTGRGGMETGAAATGARLLGLRTGAVHMTFADFPSHMLHCGGPVIIGAVARLEQVRRDWDKQSGT